MSIRFLIIYASLFGVMILIFLFLSGPIWGFKLDYQKNEHIQLIQISIPTFVSYLSAAVAYAISGTKFKEPEGETGKILKVVAAGTLAIFLSGFLLATIVFHMSANGQLNNAPMSYEQYTNVLTILLGILSATTATITAYIFSQKESGGSAPQ